jgi:hypothetical protein
MGPRASSRWAKPDRHQQTAFQIIFRFLRSDNPNDPRRSGCQPQEPANGSGGLAARPQFEHLAQEHQRDNHRSRVEIDFYCAAGHSKAFWEDPWSYRSYQAVEIGCSGAESD